MNLENGIWQGFWKKILENLASVKFWLFILPFLISTGFLGFTIFKGLAMSNTILQGSGISATQYSALIEIFKNVTKTFTAWCTFNVSLVSTIVAVREIFKVQKIKAIKDQAKGSAKETKEKLLKKLEDTDV